MIISRDRGVAFMQTRHFSFALKTRKFAEASKPGTLSIWLPLGARFTIRLRGS